MVRFPTPARRRKYRQVNSPAGPVSKVPDELLHREFGASHERSHSIVRPYSSIRLLKEGHEFCLQLEDNTSGAEGWFTAQELRKLLTELLAITREQE